MKRILILDDEMSITFSLSRCLQSDHVQVLCCNDSVAAEKVLTNPGVDAVIADVRLSPTNPHEAVHFVHYIRSNYQHLPVIMMSGNEDLKDRVLDEGANYFFQKPVDLDELIELLQSLGLQVANSRSTFQGTCEVRVKGSSISPNY